MYRAFKNSSIRFKQTLVIMLTSGIVLFLACAAFVAYDQAFFRRELAEKISSLAEVMANTCTGALDFDDTASAEEALGALRGEPEIVAARIYDRNNQVFATYDRTENTVVATPASAPSGYIFTKDHLHVYKPIRSGEELIGTLVITSSLDEFTERTTRYVGIAGLVLLGSLLAAFGLSSQFQRIISGPVLHLAEVASAVAARKDYSIRANKQNDDELGELTDRFNGMLAQIQAHDVEVAAARNQLELRVEQRTRELAGLVATLNATLESSVDGILVLDRDIKINSFNKRYAQIWKFTDEQMSRRDPEELIALARQQLKNPEILLTRADSVRSAPESEHFDTYEFLDGRIIESIVKPQYIKNQCVGTVITFRDVTDRKRAEENLRRMEELYRRAIAGAGAVPYSYDYLTRSYSFMGEGIKQLIGYSTNEVKPQLWESIIKESVMLGETAGLEKDEAARRVSCGEIRHWRCDMRVVTADGKTRWISDASVQNLDAAGNIIGSMGILEDITERKQAEISAKIQSRLSRDLSSTNSRKSAAQIIATAADDLIGWDAFWLRLAGDDDQAVQSLLVMDTMDGKRVDMTANAPKETTDLHRRIMKSGAELILRKSEDFLPEGRPFGDVSRPSASLMFAPVRSGETVVGILSVQSYTPNAYTQQDLRTLQALADQCGGALERIRADEALRESESQFRLVWDNSGDGMRLTDHAGTVLLANEAYCRIVEKSKSEIEGRSFTEVHRPEKAQEILRNHQKRLESPENLGCVETEATLWNGRKLWLELSNSRLELPGKPPLLLTLFRDITQRKKSEAELQALHQRLLDTSRAAGMAEVASSVLHNVGNVLNSVNTSAGILASRLKNSDAENVAALAGLLESHRHDLPAFLSGNGRANQIVNVLQTLAQHLTSEKTVVLEELNGLTRNIEHINEIVSVQQSYARISGVTETVKIIDLIEDALRMNEGALNRHRVKLIREFPDPSPEIVVEKHKVLQILINLIRNAKYACDESDVADKQMTIRVANGDGSVRIAVIDNGVGIPAENLTRIFNHGFTTRKNGHGFGLHSGALAAKELDGKLTAHSDGPGHGATFVLKLPIRPTTYENELTGKQSANSRH